MQVQNVTQCTDLAGNECECGEGFIRDSDGGSLLRSLGKATVRRRERRVLSAAVSSPLTPFPISSLRDCEMVFIAEVLKREAGGR